MRRGEFEEFIEKLRSDDSETYEEGYHSITTRVDEALDWLIDLEEKETSGQMKSRLVELIGESTQPQAVNLLKKRLKFPLKEVRMFAYSSLCYAESSECNKLAKEFRRNNPNEEFL